MSSKSEHIYSLLRESILNSVLKPGDRIVLAQVARQYDVSVMPVREAVRRLEAQGYVRYIQNVGAEVISADLEGYKDAMNGIAYIEGIVTALSALHMSEEKIRQAEELLERMEHVVSNSVFSAEEYSELNVRFHLHLGSSCPHHSLYNVLEMESMRAIVMRRNVFPFDAGYSQKSMDEHRLLLTFIKKKAPQDEIEHAAREHKFAKIRHFFGE
ncbi:MAG: GntR family transcriptional regulator [Actinomycetaceae bacterium]|nr:GntR family transcriptional regulator [Actinomycetaceae bacterium]